MPKRATPTRSTAAAKSSRAPRAKPAPKPVPIPDVEIEEDEQPEPARPGPRSRAPETIRITTEIAGRIAGVSGRQLMNLKAEGCPVPDGGAKTIHDVAAIVRWRMDQIRAEAGDDRDEDDLEREERRTKLKVLQVKLARELDKVLDGDEYLHHLSVLWVEMNSLLDIMDAQLGPILAPISDPDECADKIRDYVTDLKKRFNPEEAMNPVRIDHDPFTDDVVDLDLEDEDAGDDDEA